MKQITLVGLPLAFGLIAGALISPLVAQQRGPSSTSSVGDNSSAVRSGNSIYFAGNTSGVDAGGWVFRINSETGQISYRDGKKLVALSEPN
jgi:hypothetical protein